MNTDLLRDIEFVGHAWYLSDESDPEPEGVYSHDLLINNLSRSLQRQGYSTQIETPIFYQRRKKGKEEGELRNGLIDLVAQKDRDTIALEFDNGLSIKQRSIAELLHCPAQLCVGMVRGGKEAWRMRSEERIKEAMAEEIPGMEKTIWLITLSESEIDRIDNASANQSDNAFLDDVKR